MFNLKQFLFLLLAVMLPLGCATEKDTLHLENVLDVQAASADIAEQNTVEEEPEAEELEVEKTALVDDVAEEPVSSPFEETSISAKRFTEPEELIHLRLPKEFVILDASSKLFESIKNRFQSQFPRVLHVARSEKSDVIMLIGKTPLNQEQLTNLNREKFKYELHRLGTTFDDFYQKKYSARATNEVKEFDGLFAVKIVSFFPIESKWVKELSYIIFYRPEFRLNVLISGSQTAVDNLERSFDDGFQKLYYKLKDLFPRGVIRGAAVEAAVTDASS